MNAAPCPLGALHHVTSITKDLSNSHAFHTEVLGLQLHKGISHDNADTASYFYYGSAQGRDSELSFFEWPKAETFISGVGMVSETGLQVAGDVQSLERWAERLNRLRISTGPMELYYGHASLAFQSAEGQAYRLIANPAAPVSHLPDSVVGLASIDLSVKSPEHLRDFLVHTLQFTSSYQHPDFVTSSPEGGMGTLIRLKACSHRGGHGSGGVHHVAWQVENEEQLLLWDARLKDMGIVSSGILDCALYKSLYFRIPEGVMFEIATRARVGFVDEYARAWGAREVSQRLAHSVSYSAPSHYQAVLSA